MDHLKSAKLQVFFLKSFKSSTTLSLVGTVLMTALCVIPWLVEEVARLVMEEGKMKDCLKTSGFGGEFNDDHTVL